MRLDQLGPFDSVFDVGGNVGEFAEFCRRAWPDAAITSFEPLPAVAAANRERARGRWRVEEVAVSASRGTGVLNYCVNQHSASTMQAPGTTRRERFGIVDTFHKVAVTAAPLDDYRRLVADRCLLKVDVEGHELEVLRGAWQVLELVDVVVCEVNQDPHIFEGSPPPAAVDAELRTHGLFFAGVTGVQLDPRGVVVQFDGVWSR